MPDEGSAAEEHAIMQEITAPFETLPADPVPLAADVGFPVVLRGYDRFEVDQYVKRTTELVAELQATRSPEAAVRRALERLGEQISGILQRAHESAKQITAQSRSEAEDRLERARQEAIQIKAAAEQRLSDLDADTDRIWAERHRIIDDVGGLARKLDALARIAVERFPPAAEPIADREGESTAQSETGAVDEADATIAMPPVQRPEADATPDPEGEATLPFGDGDSTRP